MSFEIPVVVQKKSTKELTAHFQACKSNAICNCVDAICNPIWHIVMNILDIWLSRLDTTRRRYDILNVTEKLTWI